MQLVYQHRCANPIVILDELEKAGTSKHNGSSSDSLLSFLEPSSARRIRDLALEVDVDQSAISYVATANSINDVPMPLRDRFKEDAAAHANCVDDASEVEQNDARGLARHVGSALAHGDADIGGLKGGCVVHPIASHRDALTHRLQRLYQLQLLFRCTRAKTSADCARATSSASLAAASSPPVIACADEIPAAAAIARAVP